jgi:hypothetical protein
MRVKMVNRYYCEYCKKAGCSKHHMQHHEDHCTMNPNRECGCCEKTGREQPNIVVLMALLPGPPQVKYWDELTETGFVDKLAKAMPALREAADNCPVCILSALKQKGICVYLTDFDYKAEIKAYWKDHYEDTSDPPGFYEPYVMPRQPEYELC